jgi:hypothetical protein
MKSRRFIITFAVAISLVMLGVANPASAAKKCDYPCLVGMMQQYIAAMVKHDPKGLPFAANVKFTENTDKSMEILPIGKGLWETASGGPTAFQVYAADPQAQAVACLAVMKEKDKDILLGARLKLKDGEITEVEHLVARGNVNASQPGLQKPRPGLLEDVEKKDKMSREQLTKIGLSYYDALTGEDGTLAPFAPECERHENGMTSAGGKPPDPKQMPAAKMPAAKMNPDQEKMMKAMAAMPRDCTGQISTGTFAYITEIQPRRMVVADVQKGLAVGFSMFQHAGTMKTMPIKGVPGIDSMPAPQIRFNFPSVHFYKIRKGKIYEIETFGASLPYGSKTGWE